MRRQLSAENQILARELDNGDGVCGGLVLPASDLVQSHQYRRRGDPGAAPPGTIALSRGAGCFHRPASLRPRQFLRRNLGIEFPARYPSYEIIFCVARANDPVVPLVHRLIAKYPAIPASLIVGDEKMSVNPKLNNCVKGWDAARYNWIILADANVLMPKDYIQRLLAGWRRQTGLVCSMPLGSRPQNLWAELECAFLNSFEARWQYCAEAAGFGFAQGKSMLWWREILDKGGGIRALASEIIEDAAATKLVRAQGLSVNLVDSPFEQPLGRRSATEVWLRQARWARTRRKTFPLFYAPEIFAGAVLPAIAAAYAAIAFDVNVAATVLSVGLAWYIPEILLNRSLKWHVSWRSPFSFAAARPDASGHLYRRVVHRSFRLARQ